MLVGPPASGKGTQARILEEKYGLKALSTGDMLRAAVEAKIYTGLRIDECMASGGLVPDELIVGMVTERISEPDCANGVILDGFPRTLVQAEMFDKLLAGIGTALDMVILFEADDEAMVGRVSGRFYCACCGEGYHDLNKPLSRDGICDVCDGQRFRRRADDSPETIRHRLEEYHLLTEPILPYFRGKGILKSVDAMADIMQLEHEIESLMNNA